MASCSHFDDKQPHYSADDQTPIGAKVELMSSASDLLQSSVNYVTPFCLKSRAWIN